MNITNKNWLAATLLKLISANQENIEKIEPGRADYPISIKVGEDHWEFSLDEVAETFHEEVELALDAEFHKRYSEKIDELTTENPALGTFWDVLNEINLKIREKYNLNTDF